MKLLIMQFSPVSCHFILKNRKIKLYKTVIQIGFIWLWKSLRFSPLEARSWKASENRKPWKVFRSEVEEVKEGQTDKLT
jgi:hypothetical protein